MAVGKSIGAGKAVTAVKQTRLCLRLAIVYMGLVGVSFLLFGGTFMRLWSSDDKVIEAGIRILVLAAVYQVFYASRTVYSGALRGAGDTLWLAVFRLGAAAIAHISRFVIMKMFPNLRFAWPLGRCNIEHHRGGAEPTV